MKSKDNQIMEATASKIATFEHNGTRYEIYSTDCDSILVKSIAKSGELHWIDTFKPDEKD